MLPYFSYFQYFQNFDIIMYDTTTYSEKISKIVN